MFLPTDGVTALKSVKEVLFNPRFTQQDLEYAKTFLKESVQIFLKNAREGLMKEMFKGQHYGTTTQQVSCKY